VFRNFELLNMMCKLAGSQKRRYHLNMIPNISFDAECYFIWKYDENEVVQFSDQIKEIQVGSSIR
jgi:hypothetical protein